MQPDFAPPSKPPTDNTHTTTPTNTTDNNTNSGGGFLIPFLLGVLNMLYVELEILNHATPVAGASSGAIAATAAGGLVPMRALRDAVARVSDECRARGGCYGSLDTKVLETAISLLPPDAARVARRRGNTYFAVSYPAPAGGAPAEQRLVRDFRSTADMVAAIGASTYIPLFSGPRVTTGFRGARVYDGSLSHKDEAGIPCPPGVEMCLRISAQPRGGSLAASILEGVTSGSPDDAAASVGLIANAVAGLPAALASTVGAYASGDVLGAVSELGQFRQLVATLNGDDNTPHWPADIWPGRRHPLPVGANKWAGGMLSPADAGLRQAMFDLGRAEALSWAQDMGFPAARGKSLSSLNPDAPAAWAAPAVAEAAREGMRAYDAPKVTLEAVRRAQEAPAVWAASLDAAAAPAPGADAAAAAEDGTILGDAKAALPATQQAAAAPAATVPVPATPAAARARGRRNGGGSPAAPLLLPLLDGAVGGAASVVDGVLKAALSVPAALADAAAAGAAAQQQQQLRQLQPLPLPGALPLLKAGAVAPAAGARKHLKVKGQRYLKGTRGARIAAGAALPAPAAAATAA